MRERKESRELQSWLETMSVLRYWKDEVATYSDGIGGEIRLSIFDV